MQPSSHYIDEITYALQVILERETPDSIQEGRIALIVIFLDIVEINAINYMAILHVINQKRKIEGKTLPLQIKFLQQIPVLVHLMASLIVRIKINTPSF